MEISVPATLLLVILWVGWNSAGWSLLGCLVAVLHVQAGILSSISPLHVASDPSVVQPGLRIGWGLGSKGKKVEASSPHVGSAVSEHHCCSGHRTTSPHGEQ